MKHPNQSNFKNILTWVTLGSSILVGANSFASSNELKKFKAAFPASGEIAKCAVCHSTMPKLNPFGTDYKAAGKQFTEALLKLDSDGDGFTNQSEISSNTYPGDPASHAKPNTAPVAQANAGLTTKVLMPKEIALKASDADGDKLSYRIVSAPKHGVLSGSAPSVIYTPNADFLGADSFSFKANDGAADSNVVNIYLLVGDHIVYLNTPEKKGDDETGTIDDSTKPFASAAGALQAAITAVPSADNQILISLGEGNFGDLTGSVPAFITWIGAGADKSIIGNIASLGLSGSQGTAESPIGASGTNGGIVFIHSDKTITFGNINTSGGAGGNGLEVAEGTLELGGNGGAGGAVTIVGAIVGNVTTMGGASGGGIAQATNAGGAGGPITLTDSSVGSLNSSGGASSAGTGGNGANIDTFPTMLIQGSITFEGGVGGAAQGNPGIYTEH